MVAVTVVPIVVMEAALRNGGGYGHKWMAENSLLMKILCHAKHQKMKTFSGKVFSTKQMECYNHKTTVENHTSFSSRCCKNTFKIKHNGLNGGHFDKASQIKHNGKQPQACVIFSKITYFMSTGFYKRISSDLIINIASLIAIKNGSQD